MLGIEKGISGKLLQYSVKYKIASKTKLIKFAIKTISESFCKTLFGKIMFQKPKVSIQQLI